MNVTCKVSTAKAMAALFVLRTEIDAMSALLAEEAAEVAVQSAKGAFFGTTNGATLGTPTRDTIKKRQLSAYKWRFRAAGASLYLDQGTGIYGSNGARYPITARSGGLLHFQIAGKWIHTRKVMHPGQIPIRFVRTARDEAELFMVLKAVRTLAGLVEAHNR
jgi:hypothetical protein